MPVRILHVVTTMDFGGVETLLMSIYRKIDRNKIQFDFLCRNRTECKFHDEILSLGGRIYSIPGPSHGGLIKYANNLYDFFKSHNEYYIVHSHLSDENGEVLRVAKKAGVPYRISHSHIANPPRTSLIFAVYFKLLMFFNKISLTHSFACSRDAGEWLFGKKAEFTVISNGINEQRFKFDSLARSEIRKQLGLSEEHLLVGHIGRFANQKNHKFILEVFKKIYERCPSATLLLLGDGLLLPEIKKLTSQKNLSDAVIFGGLHSELGKYYSAMDAFLFPSKYEGLGIVAVEAQCNGLPVIASNEIPAFAKVSDRMQFISLEEPVEKWCDAVIEAAENCRNDREKYENIVAESPYNINKVAETLQNFYLDLANSETMR